MCDCGTHKRDVHVVILVSGSTRIPRVQQWIQELFSDDGIVGGWAQFNLDWWNLRTQKNVLFLFYEDALKDPEATVRAIYGHLNRSSSDAAVRKVVEKSSLSYMKNRSAAFEPPACFLIVSAFF